MKKLLQRILRFLSRIWIRLLAFNVLLVFLPIAGLWSLENYERLLLRMQERSNIQQGRLLAAALGEAGPLRQDDAERILTNLRQRLDARLRIIDADYQLLADSSTLGPRLEIEAQPPDVRLRYGVGGSGEVAEVRSLGATPEETWVYLLGSRLYRLYQRAFAPPPLPVLDAEFYATAERMDGEEVQKAMAGSYGSKTRLSSDGESLTLYSAIPIRSRDHIVGVALVSKSTFTILTMLYDLRLRTFKVILISALVAGVLSLFVSMTIARPLSRLRNEAQRILDQRGRLRGRFAETSRRDEIGDLTRALAELTRRLEGHLQFTESFASDVSHEFKNPLAAIRNAADLMAEVDDPEERRHFHNMVLRDLARLENLLAGVREISQIDARLEAEPTEPVVLDDLLQVLVEQFRLRSKEHGGGIEYGLATADRPVVVDAVPDRLAQVFENLIDNARSFSPAGGQVAVILERNGDRAEIRIADQGPGIPEEHLEKIFSRFFSYRPGQPKKKDGHTGLGLAIVRAIVEAAGGTVNASNRPNGGAVFMVTLPVAS